MTQYFRDSKGQMHEFPDDATPEEIDAATRDLDPPRNASQQVQSKANNSDFARMITGRPRPEVGPDSTAGMSTLDKLRAGFGKSIADTAHGLGQLGTETLASHSGLVAKGLDAIGADGAARFVAGRAAAPLSRSADRQQAAVDESRRLDAPLMGTGAGFTGNVVGQMAQMAVPGGGAMRGGKFAQAALEGAMFSGAQPVASDESRVGNAAKGATWGVGGQAVASTVGRVGKGLSDKLSPHVLEIYRRAQQAGIPVHFSQLSDSRFVKTLASAVGYLPFSGSGKAAQAQQEGFNRAVARSFGEDAGAIGDDVLAQAKSRIGGQFEDVYGRNNVTLDEQAMTKLAQIEQNASRNLPPNEAQIVKNQIDDLLAMSDNGAMPGHAYQAFRTDRLMPMEGGARSFLTNSVRDIRKVLDDAANRSVGPQDAATLAKARGQYRNMKTAQKALGQVAGSKGDVRPASLWPIVNQAKGASPEMRELARIGQAIKDPIPDSGTAGRLLTYGLLGGAGGTAAMSGNDNVSSLGTLLLLGATAGRAMNSKALANYLAKGNKPIEGLSRLLKPAPRLGTVLGPRGMDVMMAGGRVATPEEVAQDEEIVRRFRQGR